MERLKLLITELNVNKNTKKKFSHTFKFFKDELLNKTIFVYFNVFDEINDLEKFLSIVKLANYIYHAKIDRSKNKISTDCLENIKVIFNNKINMQVSQLLFSDLSQTINSFKEMEFISLVFFLTHILRDENIKFVKLEKRDLKGRIWEVLETIKQKEYNLKEIFKPPKNVSVFNHFNGRFESGIKNIFPEVIPKDMNENDLYEMIVKFKKEIKHLKN